MNKLVVGSKASLSRNITEKDVCDFAKITGDFNKIHLDKHSAMEAGFEGCIIHGMFTGALISAVIGTLLPGEGTVYLEQNMQFKKPAYYNDTCTANVCVSEIINKEKQIYKLRTTVENQNGEVLIEGYAIVKCSDL